MRPMPALVSLLLASLPVTLAAEDAEHLSTAYGLRILHAWTPATKGDSALIYAEIENAAEADRILRGARSDIATGAVFVGFATKGDQQTEIVLPELRIASGTHLDLKPDEVALRLEGLARPLVEGDHLVVTLEFDAGPLAVEVAVETAKATAHSHAGHLH